MMLTTETGSLRLTAEELETGVIFVKSDCYPLDGDRGATGFLWIAVHASGWGAAGEGASHEECIAEINQLLASRLEGTVPDFHLTVMREFHGTGDGGEELTNVAIRLDTP